MMAPVFFTNAQTGFKICIDAMDVYYFEEYINNCTEIVFMAHDKRDVVITNLTFDQVAEALEDARTKASTPPPDEGDRWKQDSEDF